MGKIMAFSPVNIPTRLNMDDHYQGYIGVTEDINKAIKAAARTITKSRLSHKILSEILLQKAGLKCLNEAVASITAVTVWKSKTFMDPLGQRIFREKSSLQCTRSATSKDIGLLVPGYPTLSTNIMARIWNTLGFVHLIPCWLVWAEIEFTVHVVALSKQLRGTLPPYKQSINWCKVAIIWSQHAREETKWSQLKPVL